MNGDENIADFNFNFGFPKTPDREPITRYDYFLKYMPNLINNWPKNAKFEQKLIEADVIFLKLKPEITESCDIIYTIVKKYGIKSAISREFCYSPSANFLAKGHFVRNNAYLRELIANMVTIEASTIDASPPQISLEMVKTFSYIGQTVKDFNFVEFINHYKKEEDEEWLKRRLEFRAAGGYGPVLPETEDETVLGRQRERYFTNVIKNIRDANAYPLLFLTDEKFNHDELTKELSDLNTVFLTVSKSKEKAENYYKVTAKSENHFTIVPPKATKIFNNYI